MKLNLFLSYFFISAAVVTVSAQQTFTTNYGYANSTTHFLNAGPSAELPDNNYVITGHNNDSTIIVISVNQNGDINWSKQFNTGSPYPGDLIFADSSFFIKYNVSSQITNSRIFKMDINGNYKWGKSFSNSAGDDVLIWNILKLQDATILGVGRWGKNLIDDTTKILLLKMDSIGNLLWQRLYLVNGYIKSRGLDCKELSSGNLLLFGDCYSDFSIGNLEHGYSFAMKLNKYGDLISCHAFSRKHNSFVSAHSFSVVSENRFLVAGFPGPFVGSGLLFNSLDSNGVATSEWSYSCNFYPRDFALQSNHSFAVEGSENGISGGVNILQFDSVGSLLWAKKFDPQNFTSILPTTDGGMIATGNILDYDSNLTHYSYITVLHTNGNGEGSCNSVDTLFSLVKVDEPPFDSLLTINSSMGDISTSDFFLPEVTTPLYSYDCSVGSITLPSCSSAFTIFPNPFHQLTTLKRTASNQLPYTIQLISTTGVLVWEIKNITSDQVTLDRNGLSAGVYWLRVLSNEMPMQQMVIII